MPLNYLESLLSKTFASRLYVNPELQELRHAVSAAVGDEQRMKGLQAFDRYITQTFAAIPIATDRTVLFAKPYVDTSMSRSPVFRISHARLVPEKIPAERP